VERVVYGDPPREFPKSQNLKTGISDKVMLLLELPKVNAISLLPGAKGRNPTALGGVTSMKGLSLVHS
jgi:hypothetical protein